ncbi:hypothetical protein GcC1_182057, partial [Golovinomyces cichoracearum]
MLRAPVVSKVLTDHKPLTFFLKSSFLDGIYARWASELRDLNIEIEWIPGERNVVADSLSRTIFPDDNGEIPLIEGLGQLVESEEGEPEWKWKDGKDGYGELLKYVGRPVCDAELEKVFTSNGNGTEIRNVVDRKLINRELLINLSQQAGTAQGLPQQSYLKDDWYKDVAKYMIIGKRPTSAVTKIQVAAFLRKTSRYVSLPEGIVYVNVRVKHKLCIQKSEVADMFVEAHDKSGHFGVTITMKKLKPYYWPNLAKDMRDYFQDCLICASHGTANQPITRARV